MSPTQLAMVADQHAQSSYAMNAHQPFHQPNPYINPAFQPQHVAISPANSRKRRLSDDAGPNPMHIPLAAGPATSNIYSKQQPEADFMRQLGLQADLSSQQQQPGIDQLAQQPPTKKSRVNTPWTPAEEQRLKALRDQGQSWGEIAKSFPNRTEGSVKKHWYKDMHYAEFAQNDSAALLHAIREYEQSKWKVIGQKVGKPAKACEQYARDNFTKDEIAGKVKHQMPVKELVDGKDLDPV